MVYSSLLFSRGLWRSELTRWRVDRINQSAARCGLLPGRQPGSSPPPPALEGQRLARSRGGPQRRAPAQPPPLPSDLVARMHFVVHELQQQPRDVPQDEGGDQVPVNHIPKAANAPVDGPGQGSARVRGQPGPSPRPGRDSAWREVRAAPGATLSLPASRWHPHACQSTSPTPARWPQAPGVEVSGLGQVKGVLWEEG